MKHINKLDPPRCTHVNDRYGRCLEDQDHPLIDNGLGVYYEHRYVTQPSYGNLDVREGRVKNSAYNETPTNEGTKMTNQELATAMSHDQIIRFANQSENLEKFLDQPSEQRITLAMAVLGKPEPKKSHSPRF